MKTIISIIAICVGIQFIAIGQNKHLLSGKVLDHQNLPVPGATLQILNTNLISMADQNGIFVFNALPKGKFNIKISALGFATSTKTITIPASEDITILLENNDLKLDEVTVSAQKREENVQNLPFSISALSASQVQAYGLNNIKDIKAIIPNLNAGSPGDGRNVVSVRGITTTAYDPAIATYIDGVNQFGLDTYISQLLDVERIEVLRGPQGTLYGRNAMGGVINIITKQPGNQTRGFAGIDAGSYGEQRYTLGFSSPLIKNRLYLGATGMYSSMDGYYKNAFNDTHFDSQHAIMGNYFLKFLATDQLSLVLNVKHNANRNNGAFPLVGSIKDAIEKPYIVDQNATGRMSDNLFNTSLGVNYTGNGINFSSQTAYQSNYRFYKRPVDADFSPLDLFSILNNYGKDWNKVQVLTQEFKISSPASLTSKLSWTTGVYGFYQYSPSKQGTYYGSDVLLIGAPESNYNSLSTNTGKSMGTAVYGQATYAFSQKWSTTLGLRYDYEHKKLRGFSEKIPDGQPAQPEQPDKSSIANYHAVSPKINLAYQLSDQSNLYSGYSRGFRAGGINQTESPDARFVTFKPEYSNNFEIGSKNTFLNNRIRANFAVFYTELTDAQVPTLLLPQAITVSQNAGKLRSKGFEAELSATPLKGLALDANLGYTDAKYTDLKYPDEGQVLNLDGNKQIFTPDLTAMFALQYSYQLINFHQLNLIARTEYQHIGDQYFDLKNELKQDAYNLLNAKIGVSNKTFDLFFWGKNLGKKAYVDYAYDFGAAHLGNPRTFGISLNTRF